MLQLPRQAGHGMRMDGALACRKTDGNAAPQLPPPPSALASIARRVPLAL